MKTTLSLTLALSALNVIAAISVASGQSFSIDWHSIDGGGGTSTGGVFSVSGTLGQPDANSQSMTNGTFSLIGGFWSIFTVPTPDAPLLSLERQGANVRIFWPLPATGFVLDQSLNITGVWSQVAFPYTTNATHISISVPVPTGNKFYLLRRP